MSSNRPEPSFDPNSPNAAPGWVSVAEEQAREEVIQKRRRMIRWVILSLVTLLWHLMLLILKPEFSKPIPPPPIEIHQVNPADLERIKEAWKQKNLLISHDKSPIDHSIPPPKNARYDSDRNRNVEKEQRARVTNVVPTEGGGKGGETKPKSEAQAANKPAPKAIPLSKLSNLAGIDLSEKAAEEARQKQEEQRNAGPTGQRADQALLDKSLPQGDQNILNTQESVYYSFYSRIYETIGPLWQSNIRSIGNSHHVNPGTYTSSVDVVLDPEGNLVAVNFLQHSSVQAIDQAVTDSWQKIHRFPNPPPALLTHDGNLHMGWTFTVEIDQGFGVESDAPARNY